MHQKAQLIEINIKHIQISSYQQFSITNSQLRIKVKIINKRNDQTMDVTRNRS